MAAEALFSFRNHPVRIQVLRETLLGLIGACSVITHPARADDGALPSPRFEVPLRTELSVRQAGGGTEQGLLSKIKGPAALLDVEAQERRFESIAGALTPPSGGKRIGYFAGTASTPLFGSELKVNYLTDENGGTAVENRLSKQLDAFRLSLSTTVNRGIESNWTGSGTSRASRMTEAWANWTESAVLLGLGMRTTTRADGTESRDFRTSQALAFGPGMFVHSTGTTVDGRDHGVSTGALTYFGMIDAWQLTTEFDYGGTDLRPTTAQLNLERIIGNGWSVYGFARQPLDDGSGRLDLGVTRQFGGIMASAYGGGASDGTGYVGLRLWIPLSPTPKDSRWLGF
jgi:hypothetical protein